MESIPLGTGFTRLISILAFCPLILTAASVNLARSPQQIEISVDGRPFTTYYFDPEIAKPYLMPLRTASGAIVTRDFPMRNDASKGDPKASAFEPHQRPLYFGHGDIDGLDFWQEPIFDHYYSDHGHQAYGHMVLKNIEEASSQGDAATVRARFILNDPNNRAIAEETQTFTFRGDRRTRMIDCEFVLYATNGPLDIGDTKEGTFGIRLAPELSAPLGRMLNSNGAKGEKAIWGKPADWVDYQGVISGKPVGIAVFDSPSSFRHPTTWHARAYGLFAANPFGAREFTRDPNKDGSWSVPEGKSVTFRYRVLIHEGEFDASEISTAYSNYANQK
jgi:Methane oxygenase PmoA